MRRPIYLAEVSERVHAAEAGERAEKADGRRRQAGPSRPQVVETAAGDRLGHGGLDELGDRGAAVALRLRVETEHTCRTHRQQRCDRSLSVPQRLGRNSCNNTRRLLSVTGAGMSPLPGGR